MQCNLLMMLITTNIIIVTIITFKRLFAPLRPPRFEEAQLLLGLSIRVRISLPLSLSLSLSLSLYIYIYIYICTHTHTYKHIYTCIAFVVLLFCADTVGGTYGGRNSMRNS